LFEEVDLDEDFGGGLCFDPLAFYISKNTSVTQKALTIPRR